jgi:hypothetical protein
MSLLTLVQNASVAVGLSSPSTVVGNSSQAQMLALAQLAGQDLRSRGQWKALRRVNNFTLSTSAVDQGAVNSTIVTAGDFDYIFGDTFWNIDRRLPIAGPLSEIQEEQIVVYAIYSPFQQWVMRGGNLFIYPQPTSADDATFEYMSSFYAKASGGTLKSSFTLDTDLCVLDESLMVLQLIWMWKRANGLDYAQEFDVCEKRIADALAREGGGKRLRMDGPVAPPYGVVVPLGNWPL